MPVIKSAIKKLRRDRKREKENDLFRKNLDKALRSARKQKTASKVKEAVSIVDKAVKKNLLHKNKAARIKSSLAKLSKSPVQTNSKSLPKKAAKKVKSKTGKTKNNRS